MRSCYYFIIFNNYGSNRNFSFIICFLCFFKSSFHVFFLHIDSPYIKKMVCEKGIEPPTCGLGNRRSILLSYEDTTQKHAKLC